MKFGILSLIGLAFSAGLLVGRLGTGGGETDVVEASALGEKRVLSALSVGERDGVDLDSLMEVGDGRMGLATVFSRVSGMNAAEIDGLLGEIALAIPDNRKSLEDALILRLTEIDLGQAWTLLVKRRPGDTDASVHRRANQWVHKIFSRLAKEDLEAGMKLVEGNVEGWARRRSMEALLDNAEGGEGSLELIQWAKSIDPKFAEFGDSLGNFSDPENFILFFPDHGVFSRWAQKDSAGALGYVLGLEGGAERKQGIDGIAEGLAVKDPDAAVAFANGLEKAEERSAAWWKVMAIMASTRPADAARLFDEMPNGQEKQRALWSLSNRWIRADPLAAKAWLESLPESRTRQAAYKSAAGAMVKRDPVLAIEMASQLTGVNARRGQMAEIVRGWLRDDVGSAIAWIDGQGDAGLRSELLRTALPSYAHKDPDAAAAMYQRLAGEGVSGLDGAAGSIAYVLASRDSKRALAWAEGLNDDGARREAIGEVVEEMARRDAGRAAAMMESGLAGSEGTARFVAQKLIEVDPAMGFEWSMRLEPDERRSAVADALYTIASGDPQEAAQQLEVAAQFMDAEDWQGMGNQAEMIGKAWGRYDLNGALEWAGGLEPGDLQDQVMGRLVGDWAKIDPVAASEWIAGLDPGIIRQYAAIELAKSIRDEDPESSFVWSQTLAGPYRMDGMGDALETWGKLDAEAARAAAMAVEVSEEERGKLLERLGK